MIQQTAVEWLEKICQDRGYFLMSEYFEQAKEMEKEQMGKCYNHGSLSLLDMGHGDSFEDYYNKNYNK
jgi:hypothetical protein